MKIVTTSSRIKNWVCSNQCQVLPRLLAGSGFGVEHPTVRLVLLNISRDAQRPVIELLNKIRSLGVIVQTAEDFPSSPLPFSQDVLDRMTAEQFHAFTPQLNIDPSVLIALANDNTNRELVPESWHSDNISDQMKSKVGLKVSDSLFALTGLASNVPPS
jgi:hypothetical protein